MNIEKYLARAKVILLKGAKVTAAVLFAALILASLWPEKMPKSVAAFVKGAPEPVSPVEILKSLK